MRRPFGASSVSEIAVSTTLPTMENEAETNLRDLKELRALRERTNARILRMQIAIGALQVLLQEALQGAED